MDSCWNSLIKTKMMLIKKNANSTTTTTTQILNATKTLRCFSFPSFQIVNCSQWGGGHAPRPP